MAMMSDIDDLDRIDQFGDEGINEIVAMRLAMASGDALKALRAMVARAVLIDNEIDRVRGLLVDRQKRLGESPMIGDQDMAERLAQVAAWEERFAGAMRRGLQ